MTKNLMGRRAFMGERIRWLSENAQKVQGNECLLWPFSFNSKGYGHIIDFRGRQRQPHSIMNELAHGPAPGEKSHTLHSCHNPRCVNPNHLRWGSARENVHDRMNSGRSMRGEAHVSAKLTEQTVREIRSSSGSNLELGERYSVNQSTIQRIRANKYWKHVQ